MSQTRHRVSGLALVLIATLSPLAACGSDASTRGSSLNSGVTTGDELADLQDAAGVPEACREAFPTVIETPDISKIDKVPAGWPTPTKDATLCGTNSMMDGARQSLDFAIDATADEILDQFERTLPEDFDAVREDQGAGEMIRGTAGSTGFQVNAADGHYTVTFGE